MVALTFDPFREMDRLAAQLWAPTQQARTPRWMPMDLYRAGDHYVVNVDLPGVDPGSIDVNVEGTTLTLRAERTIGAEESAQWLAQERPSGGYMRQISLGEGLDLEKIHASYDKGVLCLTIPVAEQSKPRRIEVQTRGGADEIAASQQSVQGEVTAG